jgi:aspartate aminotransferase
VQAAYDEDDTPVKHNIGLSGFREDSGRLFVPPSVRQVERALLAKPSNLSEEPLPVEGYQPFLDAGAQFAYGDNVWAYKKEHVSSGVSRHNLAKAR